MSEFGFNWLNPPQISREDRTAAGCDCGGLRLHTQECSLWTVDREAAFAAITDAEERVAAHGAWLNSVIRSCRGAHGV